MSLDVSAACAEGECGVGRVGARLRHVPEAGRRLRRYAPRPAPPRFRVAAPFFAVEARLRRPRGARRPMGPIGVVA